ncbi:MAG: hypothetical protein HFH26_08990 [Clostridiaceae bacterium]|nr:hypothetical protein [Clostridiaceae bacterium]
MNRFRGIQLTLLEELDQACRRSGIPYILTGYTAHAALIRHALPDQISVPTVAMTYADARKVQMLLQNPKREFEDAMQNRTIDRAVLRYSDADTFFQAAEDMGCFHAQGICVEIELIRGVPERHWVARLLDILDAAGVVSARLRRHTRWGKPLWAVLGAAERCFFQAVYRSGCLLRWPCLRISRFPRKSINFPRSFLLDRKEVLICGRPFFVPKDSERFMKTEWGFDWEKAPVRQGQGDLHLSVWDCDTPYRDFPDFADSDVPVHWVRWFLLKACIRRLRRKIEAYWNILFYTKERFSMARLYLPRKAELLRRYSAEGAAAVIPQLSGYLDAIERQMANGLGLYFDDELFDLAMEALTLTHGSDCAARVRAAVPPAVLHHKIVGGKHDD